MGVRGYVEIVSMPKKNSISKTHPPFGCGNSCCVCTMPALSHAYTDASVCISTILSLSSSLYVHKYIWMCISYIYMYVYICIHIQAYIIYILMYRFSISTARVDVHAHVAVVRGAG